MSHWVDTSSPSSPQAAQAVDDPFANRPPEGVSPFPLRFYTDLLDFLSTHPDIEIITYADLAWGRDYLHTANYPIEKQRWEWKLRFRLLNPRKIYVLIQNDVDSRPERTIEVLKYHSKVGVPANVMIFNRRVDRRHLIRTGVMQYTPYELDHDYLEHLQRERFVIGYHMNAHEQAGFDIEQAQEIFLQDVADLRRRFTIQFMSAHGGAPGPNGKNNRDIPLPRQLDKDIRWVHNGYSPYFHGNYSDGGINSPKRDPLKRDLRDFVRSWKRGCRYRILLHPQYYSPEVWPSPALAAADWYKGILQNYSRDAAPSVWDSVTV